MLILGVSGSLRRGSHNTALLRAAARLLPAGVELVRDRATKECFEPLGKAGALVTQLAFERGLICRGIMDTVAFAPPLCITKSQVDDVLRIFASALDQGQKELLDYL